MTSFLKEGNGDLSLMRLLTTVVVLAQVVVWVAICIKRGDFIPMPGENVGLIGTAMAMKAWQKGKEPK